jgi:hypothetical protein
LGARLDFPEKPEKPAEPLIPIALNAVAVSNLHNRSIYNNAN